MRGCGALGVAAAPVDEDRDACDRVLRFGLRGVAKILGEAKGGSAPRKLTNFSGVDGGPLSWSPDSKLITFRQGVSPRYSIYDMQRLAVVPAEGGGPVVVAATAEMGTSGGQGPDSCNLAACHNCALVPETACERFNRYLDRALVTGSLDNSGAGFFVF